MPYKNKKVLFPGTFDPFTIGHASLVERVLKIFDHVVIAIGVNQSKKTLFSSQERLDMIQSFYRNNPHISVVTYDGLTALFAKEQQMDCIIRGVRSDQDMEYERPIAEINEQISGIETLFIFSLAQYQNISSSVVRELMTYKQDVSPFLPKGMILPQK
ncbi:MAG TPA: pantetheine-phosphate adenylyltransferase [Porphyromonadaceae bacterium]|nr:pantetheine-phosphate adenylyltransferase [Porphyromonadaceae bacterium]